MTLLTNGWWLCPSFVYGLFVSEIKIALNEKCPMCWSKHECKYRSRNSFLH